MATRNMGTAASNANDVATKGDITSAINAADGTGLTDNGSGVLSVAAAFRTLPVAFHSPGTLSVGVKTPEFICPVAGTISPMRGRVSVGSGATYRLVKNGSSNMDTASATGTTVVSTTLSTNNTVAAGDRVQLEIVNAGTSASNLSVTAALVVSGA
jgi:hypothetical protein